MLRIFVLLLCMSPSCWADSVVPTRTIRANAIIQIGDVGLKKAVPSANGFAKIENVVGQEARVVLYPGRPILLGDIGPPALVTRNQIVRLAFTASGLHIVTEGRALERGGVGDIIRIMNLSSRSTLFGSVQADGSIRVNQ